MYPKLTINVAYYKDNLRYMHNLLKRHHIKLVPVTKVFRADDVLMDLINQSDIDTVADSRIGNLKAMKTTKKKMLLRIPEIKGSFLLFLNSNSSSDMTV